MKKFLISIDTEGDNLWNWKFGDEIYAENANYIPRFQRLCENYGFFPTYLVNYEIANSKVFQKFARKSLKDETCEIGLHIHAWNSPPLFDLSDIVNPTEAPYLIEYPYEIMEQKIAFLVDYLSNTYGMRIHSHRAGRWTINDDYFDLIAKYGVNVDCTVTPGIDWSHNAGSTPGSFGTDYSSFQDTPYRINTKYGSIKEIPVTVKSSHHIFLPTEMKPKLCLKSFYNAVISQMIWLRPNGRNLKQMIWLLKTIEKDSRYDYIMFMLHSSELMPGGSPTFRTEESIEKLYTDLDTLFKVACHSFEGSTISEYAMGSSI